MAEPRSSAGPAIRAGSDGLAATRVRFLTAEPVEPTQVRRPILASWQRSRDLHVAADHIALPYTGDPNLDTPLVRSADRVLRSLREQLDTQPMSIILTNSSGVVLTRLTGDSGLERHLDSVLLAPGFNYSEGAVGTNGIGTALEAGGPMHVFGHEHYAENLEDLACAGVPIHHPVSGKTIGAVDLTCWRKDAGPLLITLAKSTAEQIRRALLTDTGTREIELLHEYLRTCRRSTGIVFAMSDDVVMMNDLARTMLSPADQAALLRQAGDALAVRQATTVLELPSGSTARMHSRPVGDGVRSAGVVVQVRLVDATTTKVEPGGTTARMLLPGLVGSGTVWRHACDDVESVYRHGERFALEGEPGVGKLAVLRAVHQRHNPAGRFCVLDAAEATDQHWQATLRRTLLEESGTVVIRHVDRLGAANLRCLSAALQESVGAGIQPTPRIAFTLGPGAKTKAMVALLRMVSRTVQIPPLRHHIEDLQQLVPFLLARLGYAGTLTCSPEAMQLLMRAAWPGNVEQVFQMLRQVVQNRRTGAIQPSDLPPEARTVSRRLLSTLESMERDAIVQGLLDAGGNKAEAARGLGMSRATIYRKIHEYGIVAPVR
ncbi:MAG: GAF domain-containing protein [Actinomycetota bacterium]|nr:GAF domain-containing protein [Actinomycetota bacterium]